MTRKLIDGVRAVVSLGALVGMGGTLAVRLSGRTIRWSSTLVAFVPMIVPIGALLGIDAAARGQRRRAVLFGGLVGAAATTVAPRARASKANAGEQRGAVDRTAATGDPRTLRVVSANLLKGRADVDVLLALVREHQPDVLFLQEQNPRFLEAAREAGLFALLPHMVAAEGGRSADGAILSRHPLTPAGDDLPSEFVAATMALPGGAPLPLICAHPWPPAGPRHEERWLRSMAIVPAPTGPFAGGVLAGDFNATLDHPEFRQLLADGWQDAGRERGGGLRPTWGGYGFLRLTIDHILAAPGLEVVDYDVHRLPGSDHQAIRATLRVP